MALRSVGWDDPLWWSPLRDIDSDGWGGDRRPRSDAAACACHADSACHDDGEGVWVRRLDRRPEQLH